MKLFTIGPVEMYPHTLQVASKQLPYFRDENFSQLMKHNEQMLKDLLYLKDGRVAFLTGSGTAAMESVVCCCLRKERRVLIINGGTFGQRFCDLCALYEIPYDELKLEMDEALTQTHLDEIDGAQYSTLLVNIHETSTGQLYDLSLLSTFVTKYHLSFVIDAISSFLADAYNMDKYHIDCTILSSQKALALAPGVSMVAMQNTYYDKKVAHAQSICCYLDIKSHMHNMERGQTPFTPAVGILLELADMLDQCHSQSVEQVIQDTKERAMYFRTLVSTLPIILPTFAMSNAITPIYFPKGGATRMYTYLRDTYGIYVTPSGGELADHLLRIGHLGNVTLTDYLDLYHKMKECIE